MKTRTRAAVGARKKSAGRKAPAKKSSAKKSGVKKASGSKSRIRKAATSRVEDPVPERQANGNTHGQSGAGKAEAGPAQPVTHSPRAASWADLMHRVIDVVDPSSRRDKSRRPRAVDERPIARWIAASFLAGGLFAWVLAAVL